MKKLFTLFLLGAALIEAAASDNNTAVLRADKPGARVAPTMYGIFFEDINYGADGGLYAEMVKNRSFEFPQALLGWRTFGKVEVRDDGPFLRNPHYVRLLPSGHREKHTGMENEGYFGVTFHADSIYRFSAWLRAPQGRGKIRVELCDPASMGESQVMAAKEIEVNSKDWRKYEVELKPVKGAKRGVMRIFMVHPDAASVDVEHVSLFPADTWNGHANGLRRDLVQALADLKPGVFRFPGGCVVEGTELSDRYQWKNTVGPVENRPTNLNRWQYTFPWRFFPDYHQSGGLGFFEYFQLAEEIGAEPLPVINVGLVCQYQNDDLNAHVPVSELEPYIQDAIDLVEFANGSVSSKWGALRAEMGHPAPFGLKFMAIGNEQWGPEYVERLEPFIKAMRQHCPEIRIIGSSGPQSEGEDFDYLWPEMRRLGADLVDEHYYRPESWFLSQGTRYDHYPRKGTKVFAGEYACHGRGKKWNHFNAALMEAAFMTGLERNADVVEMATYAPLLAHVEGWQWRPDLIWFDNERCVRTSSYYVQQLYSLNKGERVLPLTLGGKPLAGLPGQNGLYASAVAEGSDIIIKIANTSEAEQTLPIAIKGFAKADVNITLTRLQAAHPEAENTLDHPDAVKPETSTTPTLIDGILTPRLPGRTFSVYRLSKIK